MGAGLTLERVSSFTVAKGLPACCPPLGGLQAMSLGGDPTCSQTAVLTVFTVNVHEEGKQCPLCKTKQTGSYWLLGAVLALDAAALRFCLVNRFCQTAVSRPTLKCWSDCSEA